MNTEATKTWTADNTPNGVFVDPKHRGLVALFYRAGAPTRMCPGQLMLIENYTGGIARNLEHWGYHPAAIARRAQSDEEHNHAALCGRSLSTFYQDWQALMADERAIAADCPRLGLDFVHKLEQLAKSKGYQVRKQAKLVESELEPEMGNGMELDPEERSLALRTAREMGLSQKEQLSLFDTSA